MRLLYFFSLCSFLIFSNAALDTAPPVRLARAVTFSNKTGSPIKVVWYSYHQFGGHREERDLPNNSQLTAYDVGCQNVPIQCAYRQITENGQSGDDIPLQLNPNNNPETIVIN